MNVQAYTVMAENIILDFNYSKRKKKTITSTHELLFIIQLSTVKYQTASAATYQDSVQQRQRLVSYKLQEPRYCWRNILLFVWLVQRPNILQCFLTGKIPLLHYTINDDVQRDSFGFQSFQSLLLHCFMMFKEIFLVF